MAGPLGTLKRMSILTSAASIAPRPAGVGLNILNLMLLPGPSAGA